MALGKATTMLTMLTEQDVMDAAFVRSVDTYARSQDCTPQEAMNELANSQQDYVKDCARYERGVVLLKDYIVLTSERSVVGGRFDAKTAERIVSPVISMESGHIATSVAYRAVALAQR